MWAGSSYCVCTYTNNLGSGLRKIGCAAVKNTHKHRSYIHIYIHNMAILELTAKAHHERLLPVSREDEGVLRLEAYDDDDGALIMGILEVQLRLAVARSAHISLCVHPVPTYRYQGSHKTEKIIAFLVCIL